MTTWLHRERLKAVREMILAERPTSVLDLGCGDGDLFVRLAAEAHIERLVGIDICEAALDRLRQRLRTQDVRAGGIDLRLASMTKTHPGLVGFDCVVLIETIEHLDPGHLCSLERAVFREMRPRTVIVTTPNAEFNMLLGVPSHRFRHPDHKFEWSRAQFRAWASRVGEWAGYGVAFHDVGGRHPELGGASQMAVFRTFPRDDGTCRS